MNAILPRFSAALRTPDQDPFALVRANKTRQYHVMDTAILCATSILMAAANLLLATEAVTNEVSDLRVILIPLMGSIIVSCGAILLNPQVETRNIVIGRAAIALLFGAALPSAIGVFFESTQRLMEAPAILLIAGGGSCGIVYVLSRPFFARLYERADLIAKREVKRLERITGDPEDSE